LQEKGQSLGAAFAGLSNKVPKSDRQTGQQIKKNKQLPEAFFPNCF